ncbi:Rieske 2Fe-2S domain-containing protein [Rhodococcus koreensis]|uniref:aromatic ring-hydroxylating dioxygenase subunit alpha n=1 Tax=Rhodococcus sp. T2V TaxID=3034164 RepID=UPI0023E31647|nr:aromatic ring-hydroxylating dioxygenase subunit alpha [Rhodococcus sp. T2V]MDF3310125.1 aromatic ring-hydroxylating dioxygenase subunit alpha [Rhodococcus sp. T2V]
MFIKNAWYVAGWSHEVSAGKPLQRMICGEAIVLFRSGDEVVALADACAHRQYPLSSGRLVEGRIRCGYHGFEYDSDGVCQRVPGQKTVPAKARVRRFPVVLRNGWIWIWPGDTAGEGAADPGSIPDTPWLTAPEWDGVTFTHLYDCRSSLVHDNLLDLTHEAFIHETSIGDDAVYENGITVEVAKDAVVVDRFMPNCHPSDLYVTAMGVQPPMDRWHTTEFRLPSLHVIHCGVTSPGASRESGYHIEVLNAITPATENSTWYFYGNFRDFALGDDDINALMRSSLSQVLAEDADALAKQERMLTEGHASSNDVLIAQDAGVARARRMMQQLLDAELTEPKRDRHAAAVDA